MNIQDYSEYIIKKKGAFLGHSLTEQNRIEYSRVEQNRTEQNRIDQNRIEQNRIEQNRIEQNRIESTYFPTKNDEDDEELNLWYG